jgi:hypothetical protein
MRSVRLCAAITAALLLVGCANAVPPAPAPPSVSYLSLLDGNAIHPLEGANAVPIHPTPSFTASATESIEVQVDSVAVRFNQTMSASGSIVPSGVGFLLELKTLSDERRVQPEQYTKFYFDYLEKKPSAAGTTTKVTVSPFGQALSTNVSGGAANTPAGAQALQDSSPERFLMLLVAREPTLRQGEILDRGDPSKGAAFKLQLTVQGRGVYRSRPVIVLTFDGADMQTDNTRSRIAGFIFLDEAIGISSYVQLNLADQSTVDGKTAYTVSALTMSADLSAAGPTL